MYAPCATWACHEDTKGFVLDATDVNISQLSQEGMTIMCLWCRALNIN